MYKHNYQPAYNSSQTKYMENIIIRKANIDDSAQLAEFITQLDSESEYLLFGSGERKITTCSAQNYLLNIHRIPQSSVYIAINQEQKIVGFICGEGSDIKRIRHVIKVNIGVLKCSRGTKIARELAIALLQDAKINNIHRIEVSIIRENILSINLCKKFGFEIEGLKKSSIKIQNRFHDEYLLAKIF